MLREYRIIKPDIYVDGSMTMGLDLFGDYQDRWEGKEFVVFDTETTGLNPMEGDKIIEIGACRIKDGKIVETFQTLINPQKPIPLSAMSVNNISDEMVKDMPTFDKVASDFYNFAKGCTLVAHNIGFDIAFISEETKELGIKFDNPTICTLKLAKCLISDCASKKLGALAEYFEVEFPSNAHRALADSIVCARVFIEMVNKYDVKL